jgi:hypothetical protein
VACAYRVLLLLQWLTFKKDGATNTIDEECVIAVENWPSKGRNELRSQYIMASIDDVDRTSA